MLLAEAELFAVKRNNPYPTRALPSAPSPHGARFLAEADHNRSDRALTDRSWSALVSSRRSIRHRSHTLDGGRAAYLKREIFPLLCLEVVDETAKLRFLSRASGFPGFRLRGERPILPMEDLPMSSRSKSSIASHSAHRPRRRSPEAVPRHRTLDGVVAAVSQADGIGLSDVDAFSTLVVRTDNSVYRITILRPHAREVLVQGGTFFPKRTRACLSGSNFGGSCLKTGWVGLGLHMEFHAGGQWIITSHVRAIEVEASATGAPC